MGNCFYFSFQKNEYGMNLYKIIKFKTVLFHLNTKSPIQKPFFSFGHIRKSYLNLSVSDGQFNALL